MKIVGFTPVVGLAVTQLYSVSHGIATAFPAQTALVNAILLDAGEALTTSRRRGLRCPGSQACRAVPITRILLAGTMNLGFPASLHCYRTPSVQQEITFIGRKLRSKHHCCLYRLSNSFSRR